MSSVTKAVAASSAMLSPLTAQAVASERGVGGGFRDEEQGAQSSGGATSGAKGDEAPMEGVHDPQ